MQTPKHGSSQGNCVVVPSAWGPLALTIDQVRAARNLASDLLPPDRRQANKSKGLASGASGSRLIAADAAARELGVPASWLLQRAREGRIPHVKLGKYVRFDIDEIRAEFTQKPDRHAD